MGNVKIRFFAAAAAAANTRYVELPTGTLAELMSTCSEENTDLARILPLCSYLVDGVANHDMNSLIPSGSEVDVLPKFAGG